MEINHIYCGDCLEIMRELPNDTIDYIITSPPYNMGGSIKCKNVLTQRKKIGYKDKRTEEEYYNFLRSAINEMLRITKFWVFFNIQPLSKNKRVIFKLIGTYYDKIKEIIIWHKKRCPPSIREEVLSHNFEFIFVLSKDDAKCRSFKGVNFRNNNFGEYRRGATCWLGEINDLFYKDRFSVEGIGAIFPIWLTRDIIRIFSKENEIILDPFLGSGTTAVACVELGRKYIGIEINPKYCKIAEQRIKNTTRSFL